MRDPKSSRLYFIPCLMAFALVFAAGLAGLARYLPAERLLVAGLLPFIPGDLVKAALAAVAFPTIWRRVDRRARIDA